MTGRDQFEIAAAFSEFEASEAAEVLRKAEERMALVGRFLIDGVGRAADPTSDLFHVVARRPDQEWRSAVGGWWNTGRDWVRRHARYLQDERRADRFTKGLAYLCICHQQAKEEGFVNWYVDGGSPMSFWRRTLQSTGGTHYVHGVTQGDETHPFITAADRIARAFPKMNHISHDNEHLRHIDLKAQMDKMHDLRYQFKTTVTAMNPRDVIIVERDAFPHGPSTALPEALREWLDMDHRFPELLEITNPEDFFSTYPEAIEGVAVFVGKNPEAWRARLPRARLLGADEAWNAVRQELDVIGQLAEASHLSMPQKNKVIAKLKHTESAWSDEVEQLKKAGARATSFGRPR